MNPALQLQIRLLPRSAWKIPQSRSSPARLILRRSFHRSVRLRAADPPRDLPEAGKSGNHNGPPEKADVENFIKSQGLPFFHPVNPDALQHAQGPPHDTPEESQNPAFYGSALRRLQRNIPPKRPSKPRVAPRWFLENNIYLRSDGLGMPLPGITAIAKDPQKGYHRTDSGRSRKLALTEEERMRLELMLRHAKSQQEIDSIEEDLKEGRKPWKRHAPVPLSEPSLSEDVESGTLDKPKLSEDSSTQSQKSNPSLTTLSEDAEVVTHDSAPGPSDGSISTGQKPAQREGRYFIDLHQALEIEQTARGLMKLPPENSSSAGELAVQKAHLLLHYPAPGGDIYMDDLVRKLSKEFECNLLAMDAQDISELIATENLDNEITQEGRLLSYEIYAGEQEELSDLPPSASEATDLEEQDGPDENNRPPEQSFGTPIMVGRPFTIDLSALTKGRRSMGGHRSGQMPNFMRELLGGQQQKPKSGSRSHIFAPLVEALLAAPRHKQESGPTTQLPLPDSSGTSESNPSVSTENGLIIHIRDLKSIQEEPVGRQFLMELYEQVQNRRASRQPIMIVGTECANDEGSEYSRERLQDIQKHEMEEISRTIVVTPVTPNNISRMRFLEDKRRRTAAINLRHLWTMLRQKSDVPLYNLVEGFWAGDFFKLIPASDYECLTREVWSFGHVHRMATYIVGAESHSGSSKPASTILMAAQNIAASDQSKWAWAESQRTKSVKSSPGGSKKVFENSRLAGIRATATKYEKRLLGGVIEPDKISTTFNDVHAPIQTIDALQTLTMLSLVRPDAFKYGVLASDRIPGLLLYGPPGTGKTLLAKAVAKESGATVLEVSAADINDMYVGEGEKNVQALFSLAKKLSPCVVFLDEADAMFSARGMSGKRVSHRELLNQFLKEWDGMSNDSGSAFLMVATNRPGDLDDAVLRRLPRRLLIDLPTEADRLEILKIHLRNEVLGDDVDIADLATKTPFYSGSDLKNVAVAAALSCVREENELAKKHTGEEPYKHAEKRTLRAKHFETALDEISASISEDMNSLREIKKFDEQYGDKKGRKKKRGSFGFRNPTEVDKVLDTVKVRN